MTIPLDPSSLTRLRALMAQRWPACAKAQGIKQSSRANVGDDGNLYITVPELRMHRKSTLDAFARATESISRILEDEGYDIERGERDGRPTWRVMGEAMSTMHGIPVMCLDPWDLVRVARDDRLRKDRFRRDAPRHTAASDPRGPKYEHAVSVGKMAERSRR